MQEFLQTSSKEIIGRSVWPAFQGTHQHKFYFRFMSHMKGYFLSSIGKIKSKAIGRRVVVMKVYSPLPSFSPLL